MQNFVKFFLNFSLNVRVLENRCKNAINFCICRSLFSHLNHRQKQVKIVLSQKNKYYLCSSPSIHINLNSFLNFEEPIYWFRKLPVFDQGLLMWEKQETNLSVLTLSLLRRTRTRILKSNFPKNIYERFCQTIEYTKRGSYFIIVKLSPIRFM